MNISKMALFSILFSIVGVGFLFYESGNVTPAAPHGQLASHVGSYLSFEGVVCRKFESKGNLFLVIKGDYSVEVPIFFGLRDKLETEPELGDWLYVQGILEDVPQMYQRQYWPKYSVSVEDANEIEVRPLYPEFLDRAHEYSLPNAGCVYELEGTIIGLNDGLACVGEVCVPGTEGMMIGDELRASVLLLDDNRSLSCVPISWEYQKAALSKPADVTDLEKAYLVGGDIVSVRPFYGGMLLGLEGVGGSIDVYVDGVVDLFYKDAITVRGVYRTYRGRELLYVGDARDLVLEASGALDTELPRKAGEAAKVWAKVEGIEYKGKHMILNLSVLGESLQCHVYSEEKGNLSKLGKDVILLKDGSEIIAYLEIISSEVPSEAKLLDYIPIYT